MNCRRLLTVAVGLVAVACVVASQASSTSEPIEMPDVSMWHFPAPPCTVERVIDGDTFVCDDGERVRLLLIDAPEADQGPYGALATGELRGLLPVGSIVQLELDVQHRDRYGRLLVYVILPDGGSANSAMLRAGYAVVSVYPPNVRHMDRYRAIADSARAARRGLWATDAFRCLPVEHRRGKCE